MGPRATFLVILSSFVTLSSCTNRGSFSDQKPTTIQDLNGIYQEKTGATPDPDFETLDYTDFRVEDGKVMDRRLVQDDQVRQDLVGVIVGGAKQSFAMTPVTTLDSLAEKQPELKPFQNLFTQNATVRILKSGTGLRLTRIQGHQRVSHSWEPVASLQAADPLVAAQTKAHRLVENRAAFVARWKDKNLVLFERLTYGFYSKGTLLQSVLSGDKVEEEGKLALNGIVNDPAKGKTTLSFKILKVTSATAVDINTAKTLHGAITYRLPKVAKVVKTEKGEKHEELFISIDPNIDVQSYVPTILYGQVTSTENELQIAQCRPDRTHKYCNVYRYQIQGQNVLKPTDPPAKNPDDTEESDNAVSEVRRRRASPPSVTVPPRGTKPVGLPNSRPKTPKRYGLLSGIPLR